MSKVENLKEKAAGAAMNAAKTAKHLAFVAKKRMELAVEQEKIRRAYTKLGKIYYKDYVTDEEPDEAEYKPLCDSITDCFCRINAIKDEIEEAKAAYHGTEETEETSDSTESEE